MNKRSVIQALSLISVIPILTACTHTPNQPAPTPVASSSPIDITISSPSAKETTPMESQQVVLKTSKGDITLELYTDKAPNTVKNFLDKAKSGYYVNLTFHRVEDWVIQGGDPDGNGTGGGKMATELNQVPFVAGSLGVARGGDIKVSNDSQFFICTTDCNWLTGQYTNFGKVTSGMDIVKAIKIGDTIKGIEAK